VGSDVGFQLFDLTKNESLPFHSFKIDKKYGKPLISDLSEKVCDFRMTPDGQDVMVCCKREGWRNMDVFYSNTPSKVRSIRFTSHDISKIKVKISRDFNQVILLN